MTETNAKHSLIYGYHPLIEAIQAGKQIEKVYLKNTIRQNALGDLIHLMKKHEIPFQFVPIEKLNKLTKRKHQGVIGVLSPIEYYRAEQFVPYLFENGKIPLLAILDQITDVQNFGAIVRTLECAGAHSVIIPFKGAAQIGPDAIKTSAGALHYLPVCRVKKLQNTIHLLKQSGLQIIAATEKASQLYYSLSYTIPTAFIMGSEEKGISPSLLQLADKQIKIPPYGKIGSLNVSAATAIITYEIIRQRKAGGII